MQHRLPRLTNLAAVLVATLAVIPACGGDDTDDAAAPASPPPAEAASATDPPATATSDTYAAEQETAADQPDPPDEPGTTEAAPADGEPADEPVPPDGDCPLAPTGQVEALVGAELIFHGAQKPGDVVEGLVVPWTNCAWATWTDDSWEANGDDSAMVLVTHWPGDAYAAASADEGNGWEGSGLTPVPIDTIPGATNYVDDLGLTNVGVREDVDGRGVVVVQVHGTASASADIAGLLVLVLDHLQPTP